MTPFVNYYAKTVFGLGGNPSKKPLSRSGKRWCHRQSWRITIQTRAYASNTGLGAVLVQVQDDGQRRPVCYASRSLSDTEKRYAVIEKEALATTWPNERFSDYVLGIPFTLETDHKPLTVLLNSSELSKMPRSQYPSFPSFFSSSIRTRKTSGHRRYTLTCSCWPARAIR